MYKCGFRYNLSPIYWECVFSFSKERQNPRLDDCLKGKWRVGQKSATSKKKFSGKHNFRFGAAYQSDKLLMEFNTAIY